MSGKGHTTHWKALFTTHIQTVFNISFYSNIELKNVRFKVVNIKNSNLLI
jgi:hypothetical protein